MVVTSFMFVQKTTNKNLFKNVLKESSEKISLYLKKHKNVEKNFFCNIQNKSI